MHFHLSIQIIIMRLVILLLASAAVGYILGNILVALFIACFGMLLWHYTHLFKLVNWLWESKAISPPKSTGLWGLVYDGLFRQIKQQRQKQKILNEKIRRFRDGAEALPDAALVLSEEFTIQWGNKKAHRLLGVRWPGDLGQRIDNLLRAPEFVQYLAEGTFAYPCSLSSPINSEIQIEIRLMPYGSEHLLLARDISHIHRLEEMRRDFVANVSHELKTPLTVVRGYVEMVQTTDNVLDPHWKKAFDTIEGQVSRMDRLVEQLLSLSRVEINTDDVDSKRIVDMPFLISALVDDSEWLNQDKKHRIEKDIDPTLAVIGIDSELKSACANLLSNAIAYTAAGGDIKVTWQKEGNKAKFSVQDNGCGIRPEDINRLTERFYRVDKSRSRSTGGSGLGLAIVKHVLHHHNAELIINSRLGEGSEFSIIFEPSALVSL